MGGYNKKGKILLVVSIIICIVSIYASLNGLHNDGLSRVSRFTLLGILFISVVNLSRNIKEKNIYYSISNVVIAITVIVCYIIPQIIRYV